MSWQRRGGDTKGNLAWECSVPVRASFLAQRLSSERRFIRVSCDRLAFRPASMEASEDVEMVPSDTLTHPATHKPHYLLTAESAVSQHVALGKKPQNTRLRGKTTKVCTRHVTAQHGKCRV